MKTLLIGTTSIVALAATPALADTRLTVTQTSYDALNRATCTAVRMNPAEYSSLPVDTVPATPPPGYTPNPLVSDAACKLDTASTTYGPDRITKTAYDKAGQVLQVFQAAGTSDERVYATYTYGLDGEVVDAIDARGNHSKSEYDSLIRLKKYSYPSTTVAAYDTTNYALSVSTANAVSTTDYETYGYDLNDNRTSWRRRDGTMIYDCYDKLNRPVSEIINSATCANSGTSADVFTQYNPMGGVYRKRFSSTAATQFVEYTYDGLGRVATTTDYNNRPITYTYNEAGSKARVSYPDGGFVDYGSGASGYDKRDALERVNLAKYSDASALFQFVYNDLGQTISLNRGASSAGGASSYTSDKIGRLTSMTNNVNGTADDNTWDFSYSPASQVVSWSTSNTLFDYDEHVTSTPPYGTQGYDGLNRDSGIAGLSGGVGYDLRGNLTAEGTTSAALNVFNEQVRQFTYDKFNRLLTASNVGSATANLKLEYDPEGRLYRYSTDNGTSWTTFLYDGTALIGEYAGTSTTISQRYIHGPGTDQPLVSYVGSGIAGSNRRYVYANYQGSVVATTSVSGVVENRYQYGPYGEPETNQGTNAASWNSGFRFRYTGQQMLMGSNVRLYYYKARVYDPMYGRFLQTDPIGTKDDLDLYAYVGGDPVNGSDPTGTEIAGAIYGAISGGVGGYIASGGDWKGAAIGAAAGGLVGAILPPGAIAGAAGSYAGQMAGGMLSAKGNLAERAETAFNNLDHGAAIGSAIGGKLGSTTGAVVAKLVPGRIAPVVGSVVGKSPVNKVAGNTVGAVVEGAISGTAEAATQKGGPIDLTKAARSATDAVVDIVTKEQEYNSQKLREREQ